MHAAYEDLPADIKRRLEGKTATHDFAKFWDMMRARPGSQRGPLTPEQRAKKPPVSQPIFLEPPDHRPQHALLQPRLRDAHRRPAGSRE